ncbi:MAG: DMT family transporter [Dermatophilaceae bacterium]
MTTGLIPGALAMALVGSSVGVSAALVDAPLFTAQAVRYAAATVLLLAVVRSAHIAVPRPRGREWWWLAGVSGSGLVLFNVAVVRGVAHAEPVVIAVAVACAPVLLGILGPLLEGRVPAPRGVAAAVIVTAGGTLVEGAGRADAVGVAWAVTALCCEAGFTLLAVPVLPRLGAWGVSVHTVWLGALAFAILGVAVEGPDAVARLERDDLLAAAYLAVLVTAVAFVLWYSAVRALGAARAGLLTGIAPVAAAVAGAALGAGWPRPAVWAGILVVGVGLAAGLLPGRRRPRDTEVSGVPALG